MTDTSRTRLAAFTLSPPVDEQARSFLQERLAYFGRAYGTIGATFFVAGNIAGAGLSAELWRRMADPTDWAVPGAFCTYLTQWLICRRRVALQPVTLRAIDAATTTLAALFHSLMIFSLIPGELPGLSYARALLLVTFGLIARAVVVPSSPRRTLLLGAAAAVFATAANQIWFWSQGPTGIPAGLHAAWTTMWCLGGATIATLASHVIFGLRLQVYEARRLGPYTLLEKIGQGGMGVVYRASHAFLRRPTAVKLLQAHAAGTELIERFEREVQVTSQLTHPNTVAVYDYGRTPDGVFYYAMEYLEGLNLEDLVQFDGPQHAGRVAHLVRQVAASLAEAHGIGFVHRDIKPSNVILVTDRGGDPDIVKVVDFGLVKELDDDTRLSLVGRVAGTPHYLSPEAIASPAQVGPPSDLYALGCVGYFLLTGHRVFEGKTAVEICGHHLTSLPVLPSEQLGRPVPEALSGIVMSCLQKNPARRPSARELIALLDRDLDVPRWTPEMARRWWDQQDAAVMARARHQVPTSDQSGRRQQPRVTSASSTRSVAVRWPA